MSISQGDGASSGGASSGGRITRSNTQVRMVEEGEENAPAEGTLVLGLVGGKRRRQSTGKGKAPASDEQDDTRWALEEAMTMRMWKIHLSLPDSLLQLPPISTK